MRTSLSGGTILFSAKGRSPETGTLDPQAAAAARPPPCARPERHAGSRALRSARSVAARGPRPGESEGGCGFSREMIRLRGDVCLRCGGNEAAPMLGITNPPKTRTFHHSPRHGTHRRRRICTTLSEQTTKAACSQRPCGLRGSISQPICDRDTVAGKFYHRKDLF